MGIDGITNSQSQTFRVRVVLEGQLKSLRSVISPSIQLVLEEKKGNRATDELSGSHRDIHGLHRFPSFVHQAL